MGGVSRIAKLLGCLVFLLTVATAGGLLLWVTQRPATAQPRRITPTTTALDVSSPEAVIAADVKAQADHDWTTFLALKTAKSGAPETRRNWEQYHRAAPQDDFMQDIISAHIVAVKPIPLDFAKTLDRLDYVSLYGEARAYYVAIYYRMTKDWPGIRSGINYFFYVMGTEDGRWVIAQRSQAPVLRMVEAGYGFGTPDEQRESRRAKRQ